MRAVIEHPQMELVGVYVYSQAKENKDAGELCGLPPIGVKATRNIENILALKPDCILYMPETTNMSDVCKLLENGINIVTTRPDFFNPKGLDSANREMVETACRKGNASIHSTGSSPGFITEAIPLVLTSLQRNLDRLSIDEIANVLDGCSEEMLIDLMGFGELPDVFAKRNLARRDEVFEHSLSLVADALNLPIENFKTTSEFALCEQPTKLHTTTIAAGTVAGQRVTVTGYRNGKPFMSFGSVWVVTADLEPAWDLSVEGWRVRVQGDVPLDVTIQFPIPSAERFQTFPRFTAHRPVNAIPYVCAATPGIVTTVDLPQVIAKLQ